MKNKNIDIGGNLTDIPNEKYKVFFSKFSEIESLPIQQWKVVHIIAYFCKKYEQHYNSKYRFKFNSPSPTKSFEVFQIKKMASMLSSDPQILVDYMDWVYDTRVKNSERKLTSISFLTVEPLLNDYKLNILFAGKKHMNINRSTVFPKEYAEVVLKISGTVVSTYGDFIFTNQAVNDGAFSKSSADIEFTKNWKEAIKQLETLGFNMEILRSIK